MRFWITKNSEVPVREQLVRQVLLAILSEDLPAGQKLPSVRALARLHRIHSNTVSAAYHDLLDRGWLELRRGSGLYVRPLQPSDGGAGELDVLLTTLLRNARKLGHEPEQVLHRLEQLVRPRNYERIVVVEPDSGMQEILRAEIEEHLRIPVDAIDFAGMAGLTKSHLVASLATRASALTARLPRGVHTITLRLRSVRGSLEGQPRPAADRIISIISKSAEVRLWARAMLIAVGLDPDCLCDIDASISGWQERVPSGTLVITDVVAARSLSRGNQAKIFRVIADSSLSELAQLLSNVTPGIVSQQQD